MYIDGLRRPARSFPTRLAAIPDGVPGIKVTLEVMRKLAREASDHPSFVQLTRELVGGVKQKDFVGEARRVHEFVRDRIRYLKDPLGMEWVQTPVVTLNVRQGDCDDKATLAAAMLRALGHPSRFVVIGFAPHRYSHVYLETKIGHHWVGMETTEPWPLGKVPANAITKMVKDI